MRNKGLLIVAGIVVAGLAGFMFWNPKSDSSREPAQQVETETIPAPEATQPKPATSASPASVKPSAPMPAHRSSVPSGEEDIHSPDVMVHEISYHGSGFSPSSLTIKQGDIVVFKNNSAGKFWPASDDHPTHTIYPEFDADSAMDAGARFEFKFVKAGVWSFHDHLNPSAEGTIRVHN